MRCVFLPPARAARAATAVSPQPARGLPFDQWPDYIQTIADQRIDGEIGAGDTVERVIGAFGGDAFKIWYAENHPGGVFARTCKCVNWKAKWNRQYSYLTRA